tara:strand:+ start:176 stop:379 length:204 start_codon:yes stop_codon:yes gene_type:complete
MTKAFFERKRVSFFVGLRVLALWKKIFFFPLLFFGFFLFVFFLPFLLFICFDKKMGKKNTRDANDDA